MGQVFFFKRRAFVYQNSNQKLRKKNNELTLKGQKLKLSFNDAVSEEIASQKKKGALKGEPESVGLQA